MPQPPASVSPWATLDIATAVIFKRSSRLPFSHWRGAAPGFDTTQLMMDQAISSDREG